MEIPKSQWLMQIVYRGAPNAMSAVE